MTRHLIDGYIAYKPANEYTPNPTVTFLPFDPSRYGDTWGVLVREETISIEIPDDFDPRPLQVKALDEAIQEVRAEFSRRITQLQEQKARLLAISNDVVEE